MGPIEKRTDGINPQHGEARISKESLERLKSTSLVKEDPREQDPHITGVKLLTPRKAEDQLAQVPNEGCIRVGGVDIPNRTSKNNYLITGQTRSGKTTVLKQIMSQVLKLIGRGQDQRAIIYDPKGDIVSFLYGLLGKDAPIKILNPFDHRCVAWDMGKDIQTRAHAATVAKIFVPEPERGDNNHFFRDGARTLIRSVQESFILTSLARVEAGQEPFNWSLRDLCLALRDQITLREILSRHEETEHALEYLNRDNNDVLVTVKGYLSEIEIIAAAWQGKPKISLKEFRDNKDGSILVLGNYREANSPLKALNSVILQRVIQLLLTDQESETVRSWLFLDEFTSLGKIDDFNTVLQEGLSKGVCTVLGFQNIEVVRHLYTKEIANAIASECATKVFLKSEGAQAAWASEFLGKCEVWRCEDGSSAGDSFSVNKGGSRTTGVSSTQSLYDSSIAFSSADNISKGQNYGSFVNQTKNWRRKEESVIPQGDFAMLPEAGSRNGVEGYYQTSSVQGVWHYKAEWHELSDAANITSQEPNFVSRDHEPRYQFLKAWTHDERMQLGLLLKPPTKQNIEGAIQTANLEKLYE